MSSITEVKKEQEEEGDKKSVDKESLPELPEIEKEFNMNEPESSTCLTFQYFSCTNVESTSFQVTRISKQADYLILAGNISAFAYPYNQHLYEYLCKTWRGVFFIPGPQEFAGGPMDLGMRTSSALEEEVSSRLNFKVLTCENGPFVFPEHRVRLIGARLWGSNASTYKDREIGISLEKENAPIGIEQARVYQEKDCEYIRHQLKMAQERKETTIVVTHGCPSYLLCEKTSQDEKAYTLVAPVEADLLKEDLGPNYWIYGASGDKAGSSLDKSRTMFCVNDYDMATDAFKVEESTHVIKIKALALE